MFSTSPMKKFDIQEANKHLQLVHQRNAELVSELDSKRGQLSKVEAQLEHFARAKKDKIAKLSEQLSATELSLEKHRKDAELKLMGQKKETEQWKMLVHERDVIISKLQLRCRQFEEVEGRLYECRPSIEALLRLIYNLDGTEHDSQMPGKSRLNEVETEAQFAEPGTVDSHDQCQDPDLVDPLPLSLTLDSDTLTKPANGCDQATDRVQQYLMHSVTQYDQLITTDNELLGVNALSLGLENKCIKEVSALTVECDEPGSSGPTFNHVDSVIKMVNIIENGYGNVAETHAKVISPAVEDHTIIQAVKPLLRNISGGLNTNIFQHTSDFRVLDQAYPVVKL